PFAAIALLMVPVFYKLLWTAAGRDTIGMTSTGLELVDFDGNPPSAERRYYRLLGSWIGLLAAGIGLVWALVDQDGLAWHDHISGTFPTLRE
ncbi:MAG: RDD family protein, partial [Bryobacteraceae bacterium]